MKTLFKQITGMLAVLAFATTAFAATPNDSSSFNTLYVTDKALSNNDWGSSATISEGELLSFELHYYLEEGVSATNMKFSLENLNNKTFTAGHTETVTGKITASNLSQANGSTQVTFADDVKLNLYNVSWQKYPCQSVGCETSLVDTYSKVLTNGGMSIGNVAGDDAHYTGNVIVSYKVTAHTPVVTYDDCSINGTTVAHGSSKTFYSATETAGQCSAIDQVRTCNDGTLSGSNTYKYTTCSTTVTPTYDDCSVNGITVAHGSSKRFYSALLTAGQCSAIDQVRTCNDGTLSGSNTYKYATCTTTVTSNDDAEVDTNSATSIDEDSARLNGDLDLNDWDDADVYFLWGTSSSNLYNKTSDVDQNNDGSFSRVITGLNDDTTYYFRAVAEDDNGDKVYGSVKNFRTDDDAPSNNDDVTTNSASNIDDDSARLNGKWEGDDNVDVWFAFSRTDSTPSCNISSQKVGETNVDDNDNFAETVSGLSDNTKYYFRACAEKNNGSIDSGSIRNFTTDEEDDDDNNSDDVDATTNSATNIDEDSARLNGRMRGDDNVDVWFAFSRTDSTPSCNISSQKVGTDNVDDNELFAETVTNLVANTKYYFRACAEDNDGSIESGSIRNFVTDEDEDDNNDVDASTVTNVASAIGTNSAQLNAIVLGEDNATCYFQYGRTTSLGLTSPLTNVDLDTRNTCSSFRTGLASNSTYYYRSVLVQDGEVNYGTIRNFRTTSNGVIVNPRPPVVTPVTPNNPTPNDTDTTITIINQNVEGGNGDGLELTKWVSAEDDARFSDETEVAAGETVYYKVRVSNDTGEDLEDVVVTDRIPFYLELSDDRNLDDDDDKRITWVVNLDDGQSRTFITEMRLREDAREGDVIESFASAEAGAFDVDSNEVSIEVEDVREFNASQAGFLFGAGFFPDTMFGWLLLLLIVLAIAYFISRILVSRNENERVLAELKAARAAQNNG